VTASTYRSGPVRRAGIGTKTDSEQDDVTEERDSIHEFSRVGTAEGNPARGLSLTVDVQCSDDRLSVDLF
jgi:hypothetical protein